MSISQSTWRNACLTGQQSVNSKQSKLLNIYISLKLYVTLPASNCKGERPFLEMSRIKNELQRHLNMLLIMGIEWKLIRELDLDDFSSQKARRKSMLLVQDIFYCSFVWLQLWLSTTFGVSFMVRCWWFYFKWLVVLTSKDDNVLDMY